MENGITVCLLAYKEAENLKVIIPRIIDVLNPIEKNFEILVVDTEKPLDNTPEVCKEFCVRYVNQTYPGYGGAFRTGVAQAQYDKILYLDSDLSHKPEYIPNLVMMYSTGDYDVVIGSRYVKNGKSNDSMSSFVMSKILNTAFRVVLNIRAHDISTSFRIYSTEDLQKIELTKTNYDIQQEVFLKLEMLKDRKLRIGETPIVFEKRLYGESKRQLLKFIVSYAVNLFEFLFIKYPLLKNMVLYLIFGLIGMAVDFSTFSILQRWISSEIANIIGAGAGFLVTFFTNTFLNFGKRNKILIRFLLYMAVCLVGALISTTIIHFLKDSFNIYLVKLLAMCCAFVVQFVLNKIVTYGKIA